MNRRHELLDSNGLGASGRSLQAALRGFDGSAVPVKGSLSSEQRLELLEACMRDQDSAQQCVNGWLSLGYAISDVYTHGITPVARMIGQLWLEDRLDFGLVTLVSSRLHRLLYDFSPTFQQPAQPHHGGTLMVLPEPESQHTMGPFLLAEYFRRDGWFVMTSHVRPLAEGLREVTHNWVDLVAVSVSSDRHLLALKPWIEQVRQQSANPHVRIMVGGPLLSLQPELLQTLGGDVLGKDATDAVAWARENVLSQLTVTQ